MARWQDRFRISSQKTIIDAFQAGSNIGQVGNERQIQTIAESVPKGFYNVGKGLYDSGISAGVFLNEAARRPDKIVEAAQKLSASLSNAITSWNARSLLHPGLSFSDDPINSEYSRRVWEQALKEIPGWLGFQRLTLSAADMGYFQEMLEKDNHFD